MSRITKLDIDGLEEPTLILKCEGDACTITLYFDIYNPLTDSEMPTWFVKRDYHLANMSDTEVYPHRQIAEAMYLWHVRNEGLDILGKQTLGPTVGELPAGEAPRGDAGGGA